MNPPPIVNNTGDKNITPPSLGGGDPWAMPGMGGVPPQTEKKRMTPQERVEMIEKLYQEVLGRKPDTRDINYYKYSTLGEEEIRKQLITGKEHKQVIADGREYKKMNDRASQAETRVKMLEGQIRDQVEEFKHLTKLLKEKNRYIQEMRATMNNNYNFVNGGGARTRQKLVQNHPVTAQPSQVFTTPTPVAVSKKEDKPSKFLEKLASTFLP